jgi:hypothetical protein
MPIIYKRKSQRGSYGRDAIREALSAISSDIGQNMAAKMEAKTVRRHRDGKVQTPGYLGRLSQIWNSTRIYTR